MGMVTVDPDNTSVFIMEMLMAEGVKFPGPWEDISLKIVEQISSSHDPEIAGLELTEQICFDKLKKERDAYRNGLKKIASLRGYGPESGVRLAREIARTLLSQFSEGE